MGCFAVDSFQPGGLLALSVLIGVGIVTLWVHGQDAFPGKLAFICANIGMMFWLLAALAEIQSLTLSCKVTWAMRAWTGIAFVPTAWAIFLWRYAFGIFDRTTPLETAAMVVGPLAISLAAWTNPLHGLFYGPDTRMTTVGGVQAVIYDHGPLFHASAIYLYAFMAFSTAIVVVGAFRSHKAHRYYFLLMTFINCVPMAANLSYILFDFTLFGFDPTPFAFSVVLLLFTILIFANRLFDVNTVARDLLFFNAPNPVLVVDGRGIVVGLNTSAADLFPDCRTGTPLSRWPGIGMGLGDSLMPTQGVLPETLTLQGRHMAVQITPITQALTSRLSKAGILIMLHDMTQFAHKTTALEAALMEIEARRDDLQRQVMLDPLTGVNNRRGLQETFATFKAQSANGLVLALLDIDHFKSINDRFGHAAGDRVLRDFARALRTHVMQSLPIFRVGGEEFVILFPDATIDEVEQFIDGFRNSLAVGKFVRVNDPERVGFSAGLGRWPQDGANLDQVMQSADERLYLAKMNGRGRTVSRDNVVNIASG